MSRPELNPDGAPPPRAVIFGCAGPTLTVEERTFFAEKNPFGFILFSRNIETKDQVRSLIRSLRQAVGRGDAPVLIDQEGGRVQRLRPPIWRRHPPAALFGRLFGRDPGAGLEATRLNYRLIGEALTELGIDVDCAPVLDLPVPGADDVIGDRAFGGAAETVVALAGAAIEGLAAAGVVPVMKHIPGHGRAMVDSHARLPEVAASRRDLAASDFVPFAASRACPWAMTAHIVYRALDPDRPATQSPTVIADVIRGEIGFEGVLVSDDITMAALAGPMAERAAAAHRAGCDLVLHCSGDLEEMREVAAAVPTIGPATRQRLARARMAVAPGDAVDVAAAMRRLENLMPAFANSDSAESV